MSKSIQAVEAPAKTDEEVVNDVLALMADTARKPMTLSDWLLEAGVTNPFQLQSVRKSLRAPLSEGGSHYALTTGKRWVRTTERWAEGYGLEKGKPEGDFRAQVPSVEGVRRTVSGADVPASMRESADAALTILSGRANRKLDAATLDLAAEQVGTIVAKAEDLARENKTLREYAEDTRRTKDSLMVLLDRLTAHMPGTGLVAGGEDVRANGAHRLPTQQ